MSYTVQSERCLPTPESTYEEIIAALAKTIPAGTPGPLGRWLVTVKTEESTELFEAIVGIDGQYMETGAQNNLDLNRVGFGTWRFTDPDAGLFEVVSQRPLEEECNGWMQTTFAGRIDAASYIGQGQRTTFDLNGAEQGTAVAITVCAERLDTILATASC